MAHDFKQKEPSKTEKVLYELMMNQQGMERAIWSNSSVIMVVAMLLKLDPKDIALALNDDEKLKEFSNKINEEIKKLPRKEDKPAEAESNPQV